jgi:cytochrome c oxidase cbb3-type subunit 3
MIPRSTSSWSLSCALALAAALALTAATADAGPAKGDAAKGKTIYTKNCVACHKADGSGGVKLTGNATPNWKDPKIWADGKRTDDFLRDCITNGKPKSGMVAWKQLKPQEIEDLIVYINSIAKKK